MCVDQISSDTTARPVSDFDVQFEVKICRASRSLSSFLSDFAGNEHLTTFGNNLEALQLLYLDSRNTNDVRRFQQAQQKKYSGRTIRKKRFESLEGHYLCLHTLSKESCSSD